MKYASGAAFRMALEARLRQESLATGLPLSRLRKTVAFDRLLARLVVSSPDAWLLKGGLALQLRMGSQARTTKDIDLMLFEASTDSHTLFMMAARADLEDWFEFEVAEPSSRPMHGGVRMTVRSMIDGRDFESFHVDVGFDDPVTGMPDCLPVTTLLGFADVNPAMVPCYPIVQHVAEKIHALTRLRESRENSRIKDLVDLVVMAEAYTFQAAALEVAICATFKTQASHALPDCLPEPPDSWALEYRRMARDVGLATDDIEGAMELLRVFLMPVFRGSVRGVWLPIQQAWEE